MSYSSKIRVAVLRGGPSFEYDTSLKTGGYVLKNLPDRYQGIDVFIDKSGTWHIDGMPKSPSAVLHHADVAFNALHGNDAQIKKIVGLYGIPYTGADALAGTSSVNKIFSKNIFTTADVRTPIHMVIDKNTFSPKDVREIFLNFPNPSVVRPAIGGSTYVSTPVISGIHTLASAIDHAFSLNDKILIEEYIQGTQVVCGVIDGYRNQSVYVLPALHVVSLDNAEFDHMSLSGAEKKEVENATKRVYGVLGSHGYTQGEFVIHPKRGVFLVDVNSNPELHEKSSFVHSLGVVGAPVSHFLDHIITLAMNK